jgi:formate hydrogenlyase subunit 3/multisubunit Na+/H+ antiporter MnhD subunit
LANECLTTAFAAWVIAALLALSGRGLVLARFLLFVGSVAGIVGALISLPDATTRSIMPTALAGQPVSFFLAPDALWLLGFGLAPAGLACAISTPSKVGNAGWLFGAAMSLIGALGVFGLQDGISFLVAWEIMSFGGAVMILSEKLSLDAGRPVLFMLGLLEVGAVALIVVMLLLASHGESFSFDAFHNEAPGMSKLLGIAVGLLLIIGFGAKLGLLPFYEWFPGAYGAGSGASGALLSGVVLNAAFFGLSRGLLDWLPGQNSYSTAALGTFVLIIAVLTAILKIGALC